MKSTYKIIWSDEAKKNLQHIVDYLEKFWTSREIRKFARLLEKQLILIKRNPALYPYSNKSGYIRHFHELIARVVCLDPQRC
jgi:plasmid stabilization system protein ParE